MKKPWHAENFVGWPFPGDSPVVQARRVALAYRSRLVEADPGACAQLDKLMGRWGQKWAIVHMYRFDLDDLLPLREAAELACVQTRQVSRWRRNGQLPGSLVDGRWHYRARDVLAMSAPRRRRNPRTLWAVEENQAS